MQAQAADHQHGLRAGIIGVDTSHSLAFTELLNAPDPAADLAGVRIVAAYPAGSPDIPESRDRIAPYTAKLRGFGVEIVESIEALLTKVDVVLLESLDGRPHLEQARPVLRAKKPVFIDKPVAGTLADAVEIYRLAEEFQVPCFSSSALRFARGVRSAAHDPKLGTLVGCDAYSPCPIERHHPDLFWYGIHGVESLFTVMGPSCEAVTRFHTPDSDVVVGRWKDGRIGTWRGSRTAPHDYGAKVFGTKKIIETGGFDGYRPLVVEIVKFFKTRKAPVSPRETLEIYAFMAAADESKQSGGSVLIENVLRQAERHSIR